MSFNSNVFDPETVKALLKLVLKDREKKAGDHKNTNNWLVDWGKDWTKESIMEEIIRIKKKGDCVGTEEQMRFLAHVLEYMEILGRALIGHAGKKKPLPTAFPIYGPQFTPPHVDYCQGCAAKNPEKYLVEPIYVLSPIFHPHFPLDKCPVPGCSKPVERKGFSSTGFRTIYGLEHNIKVIGMEYACEEHKGFSTTSVDKFLSFFKPWLLGVGLPTIFERSGFTAQLADFVREFRLSLSIGAMQEHIHQLHLQHNFRQKLKWAKQANCEKEKGLLRAFIPGYPEVLQQAELTKEEEKKHKRVKPEASAMSQHECSWWLKINPAPSEHLLRSEYERWMKEERLAESEQYTRTLAGTVIGADSTIKAAKKANMYQQTDGSKQLKVSNLLEGGLLTLVNPDCELVSWRFLFSNSILEAVRAIKEFGQRNEVMGIPFNDMGEVCVDCCCDFRGSIQDANPNLSVTQDLMHLEGRILSSVSKKSPHCGLLAHELSKALLKEPSKPPHGNSNGTPAVYWDAKTQVQNMQTVWQKFKVAGDVWTKESEAIFLRQIKHVQDGCLQRRHPEIPSHTSGNENWHGRINALTRGDASSLTTIVLLIADMALRHNIRLKLRNFSQPANSPSRQFRAAALGSPYLSLIDALLREMEKLTNIAQPVFLDICPQHQFGLVPTNPK
ncbi:hypothetical protein M422DRAFT_157761 [Sphaerobolus stellatus SS14]|nr:hypothetical protein M422DRAFT_157761 [Sphaerobolus stellatus SS14]